MSYQPYATMPFYPGPVSIPERIMKAMAIDFAPPRFGMEYTNLYIDLAKNIQKIINTKNEVIFPTGEAMLGLWGALKSCLKPGDKVLTVGTGVFGDGFADMATCLGCIVEKISLPYNSTINAEALEIIDEAIRRINPVMITAVHCETPSGTLNPLTELGKLKKDRNVPLFVVDAVASIGGAEIQTDEWNCDILLGGSQKCFSCPPYISILAVSETAWDYIKKNNYLGYDSLLSFHNAHQNPAQFPYTPCWMGINALYASTEMILEEGIEQTYQRHIEVATTCRHGLSELGIPLWTAADAINSPTVTAAMLPIGVTFPEWKEKLAQRGLYIGGSFGPMADKVFRIGHMGSQANLQKVKLALKTISEVI